MYNRYIPQPDGSHHRNRIPDPVQQRPPQHSDPPCSPETLCNPPQPGPIGGFLRQLLPKSFDTGDLIIVLLLLLLAGDCQEDRSNALLTLALYFLM